MLLLKRKHDELEDSEEDEASYGKQILPIAKLPDDFNGEPMDGMQYLFTVRRDARQLPDVVRVPKSFKMEGPANAESTESHNTISPAEPSPLPSEEWRELFEYRFLNFRKNFDQPTIHVGPPNGGGARRLMPEKKDRDMWWAFLQGESESEWTPVPKSKEKHKRNQHQASSRMRAWPDEPPTRVNYKESSLYNDEGEVEQVLKVDPADSLPSPAGTPVPVPLEYLEEMMQPSSSSSGGSGPRHTSTDNEHRPREPTTTLLRLIDGKTALHLLMYFTHWIQLYLKAPQTDDHIPTESHARWIFALLSRVEEHVSADDMNLLRNLARACIGLLKDMRGRTHCSQRMGEISCWLVVTTVACVWKQRDLWIDAECILAKTHVII